MEIVDLGLASYDLALALQQQLHSAVSANAHGPTLVVCEHPDVLTLGKNADRANLLGSSGGGGVGPVPVIQTERGGEVTAHMPGQLVIYPIINLREAGLMPRRYVTLLEESIIDTLAHFDIQGRVDSKLPGVWVGQQKVAFIGVRIKNHVSQHGLAINICNRFDLYSLIHCCGIRDCKITSISQLIHRPVAVGEVSRVLVPFLRGRLETVVLGTGEHG